MSNTITREMEERLEGMVPPKELADAYVNRQIFGKEDFEVFDWARKSKRNLLIKGPTQAAKTLALRAYAASRRIPAVTVDVGAAMDPALTLGTYRRRTDNGQLEWYDGLLTLVCRNDEGVAILDECNMAHPKVMAAYHPMGDSRRWIPLTETGEVVRLGSQVLLAATMNPDYIGTTPIGQAFSARFQHIPWDYDEQVEKKLLAPSIRKMATKLRGSEHIYTPVSTHLLMVFQDTIQEMGYDFAIRLFSGSFAPDESQGIDYALDAGLDDQVKQELGG